MIKLCTQVEINAAQEIVWDMLVETETNTPTEPNVSFTGKQLQRGEVVRWEEGTYLALEGRGNNEKSRTTIEYTLEAIDTEHTIVYTSLQLESGVGWLEGIVYRFTKNIIQREVKQISAELKRKVEYRAYQGQTLAPSTLDMSAVQLINCP